MPQTKDVEANTSLIINQVWEGPVDETDTNITVSLEEQFVLVCGPIDASAERREQVYHLAQSIAALTASSGLADRQEGE